jgi:CHAD domain-containing protein
MPLQPPAHGPSAQLSCLPVENGARRLALAHLESAIAARAWLAAPNDPEALHDYRVALRRLRSCLRAYRLELRPTVTRKSYRRLRRLARGTNQSRDLEVHLAWLAGQRDAAGEAERPGVSWLIERSGEAKRRAWDEMLALDRRLFPRLQDRLRRQLSEFRITVRLDLDSWPGTTAAVTAARARMAARRLATRLGLIRDLSSETEIHRARIAAKHLRYLLEPFAAAAGGDAVIGRLKSLQNAFGDVHDTHLFVAELHQALDQAPIGGADVVPGIQSLMAELRSRGLQAFKPAAREWIQSGPGEFLSQVHELCDAIARLAPRDRVSSL